MINLEEATRPEMLGMVFFHRRDAEAAEYVLSVLCGSAVPIHKK